MSRQEFIKAIANDAKTVCKERGYGYAQYATCVAQACCESNYGQSSIMANANAYFGIKANKTWANNKNYGGLVYNSKTKECYDGRNYTNISACFRAYRTRLDSVRNYFDLLEGKRYKDSLKATTVEQCITIIKKGGYATSPTYINTILKFYNNVRKEIDAIWDGAIIQEKTTKNIDYIVDEVIRGLWGNGAERKRRLKQAGYDPILVQKAVNATLRGGH